jgi:predicted lipoprotein with Yx(FWY)xxD motif
LLGTIQRRDGSTQVTYGGHPLYYYSKDQGRGDVTGQDVTDERGEWYLVSPAGQAVED